MKNAYNGQTVPADGKAIGYSGGELQVPDSPIIPFIEGDGTGRDTWKASRRVFDAAVEHVELMGKLVKDQVLAPAWMAAVFQHLRP